MSKDKNNDAPVQSKSEFALVRRIVNFFKLGEEGKIESFFEKQRKVMKREIAKVETALSVMKLANDNNLEDLNERLEDAQEAVVTAYLNVDPERVASNALQAEFGSVYWKNVELAEANVKTLEEQIVAATEKHNDEVKKLNEQIAERKRRMVKISEK